MPRPSRPATPSPAPLPVSLLRRLAPALLLLASFATPAVAQECTDCHDDAVTSPMHVDLGCAACHADVDLATHPDAPVELSPAAVCGQCHDAGDQVAGSSHADLGCGDCHGASHDVLPPSDPKSAMAPASQVETCGACHDEDEVMDAFLGSVHARALLDAGLTKAAPSCSDCHGSHAVLPADAPESPVARQHVPETCGACHEGVLNVWRESSAHGKAWAAGDEDAPVCTTCHATHEIERPTGDANRLKMPESCGGCHTEELATYRDSFHGQATDLGFLTAATCSDCHTPHANLPAADPRSSVHAANLATTCGECHGEVTASFVSFDPHSEPADKERNAAVHWTWVLMTSLLFGVFGFFGLHALLWLQRAVVAWRRGEIERAHDVSGPWVRRFRRSQSWTHATVVVTFLLLAATGLPLRFHQADWAQAVAELFGGIGATRAIHRIAAVGTFGYFLFHVGQLLWRRFARRETGMLWGWRSLVPQWGDLRDLLQNLRWFLYLGKKPVLDRWTYWEKFDYFAVFWGVAVIGFSGLVLWFPRAFASVFPGWFLNIAHIVHADEALLATGFIFVFHFFHTHLRPETFPLDPVIFVGRMPLARFKEERPREYERMVADGTLEQALEGAPTMREMTAARVFGFTAVTIGLLLAIGILVGMVGGGH